MGNSDKTEETRRASFGDPAHRDAPRASTVVETCSKKYSAVEKYIKQHFDIVPNGVTLDDAQVIFFGESHATNDEILLSKLLIRNKILANIVSNKDVLLVEGANPTDSIRLNETDPAALPAESRKVFLYQRFIKAFEKGTLIAGWDNLAEQETAAMSLHKINDSIEKQRLLSEEIKRINNDRKMEEDEDKREELQEEFNRLRTLLENLSESIDIHEQLIDSSYLNRNKSMIESIQKFSKKDNRVFVVTGQRHFSSDEPKNEELFDSLSGKKVLYLVEKKREVKGEPRYRDLYMEQTKYLAE